MTATFKIFSISADDVKAIAASVNEPHQHDFEELIIGIAGQLEHFIDFKTAVLTLLCKLCYQAQGASRKAFAERRCMQNVGDPFQK